jgi:hypothetical protein
MVERTFRELAIIGMSNHPEDIPVLVLLFEQQKMINELIRKLGKVDRI